MTFYHNLIKACDEQGLNPVDVAKACGASYQSISMWRSGSTPRIETIYRIASHLGIDAAMLIPSSGVIVERVNNTPYISPAARQQVVAKETADWPKGRDAIAKIVEVLPRAQQEAVYAMVTAIAFSERINIPAAAVLPDSEFTYVPWIPRG